MSLLSRVFGRRESPVPPPRKTGGHPVAIMALEPRMMFDGAAAATIASAAYDASTNVLTVTGTDLAAGGAVDATKLTMTGQGGNSYTLTGTGAVSASSATQFSVTLNDTDAINVEGLLNKNGSSAAGGTAYTIAAAAGWHDSAAADTTGNAVTVSNTQKPTISSTTYDASTGVLTVTGTNMVKQPGADNDINIGKFSVLGEDGSYWLALSGTAEITSSTGFSATLDSTTKSNLGYVLNANGTHSSADSGGATYELKAADDWNGPITGGDISISGGVPITVTGVPSAPSVGHFGDNVAWAGVGNTVRLDTGFDATISHWANNAKNGGQGDWSDTSILFTRSNVPTDVTADVFGFDTATINGSDALFTVGGSTLQAGGLTFATVTGSSGRMTISFDGTGTGGTAVPTTALVEDVLRRITFRNDTPTGDMEIVYQLAGEGKTSNSLLSVTSDRIYVDTAAEDLGSDLNGVSLNEAVYIAGTSSKTLVLTSALAGQTTTLSYDITIAGALTIDADAASGYTLTAKQVTFGSGGSLTVTNGASDTITINSRLNGGATAGLTKAGAGTLTLGYTSSGGNEAIWSGAMTVNAGTLAVASDDALSSGTLSLNGGTLSLTAATTIDNAVAVDSDGGTVANSAAVTLSGILSGTGALTKSGTGTLTLSRANTRSGGTTVSEGTLTLSGGSALSDSGSVAVASGATLALSTDETIGSLSGAGAVTLGVRALTVVQSADGTLSGVISGTGALTKSGSGTLTLSGSNTYTGLTGVSAGTLSIGASSNIGTGAIVLNGGTLDITGATTLSQSILLGASHGTVSNSAAVTLSGVISGTGYNLTKTGTGTLTLSGTNTYTGTTTINAGSVSISAGNKIGSGAITLNGGTLDITGGIIFNRSIVLGASHGTISNSQSVTLSGVISGTGNLTKTGAGQLALTGTNTYTGTTTISSGWVSISAANKIGTGAITVNGGSTLDITGATTLNRNIVLGGGTGTIRITAAVTLSGVISGTGNLTKTGGSTLTLSGSNTYTGTTTVSAGTLSIGGSSNIGTAAITLDGGTLAITDATSLSRNIVLAGGNGTVNASAAATLSGVISGAGNLTKSGASTLTLSGTNTYTGTTTVSAGTLSIGTSSNIGTGAITLNGGTLDITGATSLSQNIVLGANHGTISNSAAVTLSGIISGTNNNLTKSGAGTLTLSGTYTYTGFTSVSAGTLAVTSALTGTNGVSVASGATLGGTGSIFTPGSSSVLTVYAGATLAPGVAGTNNGIGKLTVNGSLQLSGGLDIDIGGGGGVGGTDFDQVAVKGTVTLNGGSLTISRVGGYTATNGATYQVIDNDSTDAVTGTPGIFGTTAEGTDLISNGYTCTVRYASGTGNDVVLTAVASSAVTGVSASTADGSYKTGDTISITVTFDQAVTVTGTPLLSLGHDGRTASYASGSGGTTLTFTYTVQAGDTAADLDYLSTAALALNGGTILDSSAGRAAVLTLAAPGATNSLGANTNIVIDTTAPGAPGSPALATSSVTGTPTPTVTGTAEASAMVTLYDTDGTTVLGTATADGGGTWSITSSTLAAGAHTLTAKATDSAGNVSAASSGLSITVADTSAPTTVTVTVTGVTSSTTDGTYKVGDSITISVSFSEAVAVTGSPTLALNTGRTATYAGGAGTSALTFTYTVQNGDTTADLDYSSTAALSGTIANTAGTAASLTLAAPGAATSLGANKNLVIDTLAPTIVNVTGPADGTYGAGWTLSVFVQVSEAVTITNGTPSIQLDIGGTARQAVYTATGSTPTILRFDYVVQAGDADPDGIVIGAMSLNGATVTDAASQPLAATLSGVPGTQGVLIDAVAPTIAVTATTSTTTATTTATTAATTADVGNGPSTNSPSSRSTSVTTGFSSVPNLGSFSAPSLPSGGPTGSSSGTDAGRLVTLSSLGDGSSSSDEGRSITLNSLGGQNSGGGISSFNGLSDGTGRSGSSGGSALGGGLGGGLDGSGFGTGRGTGTATGNRLGTPAGTTQGQETDRGTGTGQGAQSGNRGTAPDGENQDQPSQPPQGQDQSGADAADGTVPRKAGQDERADTTPVGRVAGRVAPGFAHQVARAHGGPAGASALLAALANHVLRGSRAA
ncbi:beta strand repeat-containing protein [Azospirillum sp. sgz301742]